MTNGEKSYVDPKVLAGISNLYLRVRWGGGSDHVVHPQQPRQGVQRGV